jgi:uncharacterized membrane protein YdjX (TVP38/TMEM64 family)
MKLKKRIISKKIIIPAITIILFVVVSYFSKKYAVFLADSEIIHSAWGGLVYTLAMVTAVIVAPFETLPLLPVAVTLWGANTAANLTILGWTIGSMIALFIARRLGPKFVYRYTDKYNIKEWGEAIPKKNMFWLVAFARFVLPVDIISYAVGLFTQMHWASYLLATLVGVIPFAYLFAYGSELKTGIQITIALIILVIILFKYHKIKYYFKELAKQSR